MLTNDQIALLGFLLCVVWACAGYSYKGKK